MSFEANAYSILAGSYERFLFGHTFSPTGFTTTLDDDDDDDDNNEKKKEDCLLYTSPSPRDGLLSRMPSSA